AFCDIPNQVQQPQRLGIRRLVVAGAEGEWEMKMSALIVVVAFCFSATAFAQSPPPKIGNKPLAQKPQVPMACKLVGTVKGTKLWVGDCTDSAELRGAAAAPKPHCHRYPSERGAQFPQAWNKKGGPPADWAAC